MITAFQANTEASLMKNKSILSAILFFYLNRVLHWLKMLYLSKNHLPLLPPCCQKYKRMSLNPLIFIPSITDRTVCLHNNSKLYQERWLNKQSLLLYNSLFQIAIVLYCFAHLVVDRFCTQIKFSFIFSSCIMLFQMN